MAEFNFGLTSCEFGFVKQITISIHLTFSDSSKNRYEIVQSSLFKVKSWLPESRQNTGWHYQIEVQCVEQYF